MSVADTTGAGDAFNAALLHALSQGLEWPDALGRATSFASAIISRPSSERYRIGVGGAER
jgi:sugar/nucleoside kinase (ribokinase family)